ncbi:MAG: ABC-F family ATP-binding cassette domain-containing protein [Pirellulaceae bacterium]
MILQVRGLSKTFAERTVLDGIDLELRRGDHVALVGPNGAGKSSLLNILTGQLAPDAGDVQIAPRATIGYVKQHQEFPHGATIWSEACRAAGRFSQLIAESEALADAVANSTDPQVRDQQLQRLDRLQAEIQQCDAYQWQVQVERVLMGMGFPVDLWHAPIERLSGGQRNRLLLACVLIGQPDLLILDEPSNHLDVETTEWLEQALAASSSAVLVVSHDRYFLDCVATSVWELLDGSIDRFVGNYSAYVQQKAMRLEVQRRTFDKQREEVEKLEDFIRRHHAGQKSTQAEDRRKKLERIELVDAPREIHTPRFRFPEATRTGDIVLRCDKAAKAFGAHSLFSRLSFQILRGQRWAILGSNGAGKTTLLKCLLGKEPLDQGLVELGANVRVGYFDQLLQQLDLTTTPLDAIRVRHADRNDLERRNMLARFGIAGDLASKPLGQLSGGERNRTMLALLASLDANFLILDEPTNHLDLWSREALEQAICEFSGTVLLVTHDRYLVNATAQHVLVLRDGQASIVQGNYEDYRHWIKEGLAIEDRGAAWGDRTKGSGGGTSSASAAKKSSDSRGAGKPENSQGSSPPARKRKFPYCKPQVLEKEIMATEEAIAAVHTDMTDPDQLRDGAAMKRLVARMEELEQKLEQLYLHYEEALELNE